MKAYKLSSQFLQFCVLLLPLIACLSHQFDGLDFDDSVPGVKKGGKSRSRRSSTESPSTAITINGSEAYFPGVKVLPFPSNLGEMKGDDDKFTPTDEVLEYIQSKISVPLSLINFNKLSTRTAVAKVTGNPTYSVVVVPALGVNDSLGNNAETKRMNIRHLPTGSYSHLTHNYESTNGNETVTINLDSFDMNTEGLPVKVIGKIDIKKGENHLRVYFGNIPTTASLGGNNVNGSYCPVGNIKLSGSLNCYGNALRINEQDNKVSGGKMYLSYKPKSAQEKKTKVYTFENDANAKEVQSLLKKLGLKS